VAGQPRGWHLSRGGDSWTLSGSPGSTNLTVGSGGASATYDLSLETRGAGKAQRALSGVWIGPNENHTVHIPDWSTLESTDLEIQVDSNRDGIPDRRVVATSCDLNLAPDKLNASSNGNT
jgi:hypothetical protein